MAIVTYFAVLLIIVSIHAETNSLQKYRERWQKLDVDVLLRNRQFITICVKCLLDKKLCSKDGLLLRSAVPEILTTSCGNCTDKEKVAIRKVLHFAYTERKEDFEKIYEEYDPKKVHRDELLNFIFNNGTTKVVDTNEIKIKLNATAITKLPKVKPTFSTTKMPRLKLSSTTTVNKQL